MMKKISCKEFARHVASGLPLPEDGLGRRVQFWIHWGICPFCRRYWEEVRAIGKTFRQSSTLATHPSMKLVEVKRRLRERLKDAFR